MNPLAIRSRVIEQLGLLSSELAQRRYEQNVPMVSVPNELACGWFDDAYHPDWLDFRQAFSRTELDALAKFSAVFDSMIDSMPSTVERLVKLPKWREVVAEAAIALAVLERSLRIESSPDA